MTTKERMVKRFQGPEEPWAKDVAWTAEDIFKVAMFDDGKPQNGYAEYVCEILRGNNFKGRIWVQIIDVVKLNLDGKWVRLGDHRCNL